MTFVLNDILVLFCGCFILGIDLYNIEFSQFYYMHITPINRFKLVLQLCLMLMLIIV